MSTLENYYKVLMKRIDQTTISVIMSVVEERSKGLSNNLQLFTQKYADSFIKITGKIIAYLRNGINAKINLDDIKMAFILWKEIINRFYVTKILETKTIFPSYPKKTNLTEYEKQILRVELSTSSSTFLNNNLQQKRRFFLLQGFSQPDVSSFLATFNNFVIAISKLIALDGNRKVIKNEDIKKAEQFMGFLFFRTTYFDLELLVQTTNVAKKDIFRKLNAIKIKSNIEENLNKRTSYTVNKDSDLFETVIASIDCFVRLLAFRNNVMVASEDLVTLGFEKFMAFMKENFFNNYKKITLDQLIEKMQRVNYKDSLDVWLKQIRNWLFDILLDLEGKERVFNYVPFIDKLCKLVLLFTLASVIKDKKRKATINHVKQGLWFFTHFFNR